MASVRPVIVAAALVAVLSATGCSRRPPVKAHPALFVIRDADTTIWLLGTIHLLPEEIDWHTPAIEQAIADADMLVTEIADPDPATATAVLESAMRNSAPVPILARVTPALRPALLKGLDAADLTLAEGVRMDSWAVATSIASGSAKAARATRQNGVEAVLADRFRVDHKPQRAFETLAGQLALFDTLPEETQRVLLERSVADAQDAGRGYTATLAAWAAGDQKRIAASFNPLFAGEPLLEEALLTGRNRRWARWISARMSRPGNILVAVGAGHLAGPRSVIAMLAARGFTVKRVD